ncbi:hypothetical protein F2Q68_00039975 [Brassica cretica]|uniref:Uncharacterized protein n=1 Tax=Brassica cretica TaxID=69181 RepID=A0A8S9MJN9_BRACR|nr:hypothetical protein F2Q68_00039975 [Brassica cretica]
MSDSHLHISLALRHISQGNKWTSSRLEVPHQVSDAVRVLRNRTILGVRKLPMKQFSNNRITRNTETMVCTIRAPLNQLGYPTLYEQQTFHPRGLFPLEVKLTEAGSPREELL